MECTLILGLLLLFGGITFAVPMYDNDRYEGDRCLLADNVTDGICRHYLTCDYLRNLPKPQWKTCSFVGSDPIVCCDEKPVKSFQIISKISTDACERFPMTSGVTSHIYQGVTAAINEFPHMAALSYPSDRPETQFRCGASLISDRFLLTAAHCADNPRPDFARMGVVNLFERNTNDEPVNIGIANVMIHPQYKTVPLQNDIALLELNRTVTEPFLNPACLYTNSTDPGPDVILSIEGWGRYDSKTYDASPVLLKANVSIVDRTECNYTVAHQKAVTNTRKLLGELQSTQICALGRDDRNVTTADACEGDSGGPLELITKNRRYIVGITSSGKPCGTANSPGIYTRVSQYIGWIESIVWPDQ
ncbi:serine protease persephone-like [Uranotaenia lowii]|uniref:serine protease persephone-like n=1 Tax=Uranotaenia lowii TaxID=190385 RepID=UPI002479B41E|nr:serine protease persephone-like [Uranotaenia lowii]